MHNIDTITIVIVTYSTTYDIVDILETLWSTAQRVSQYFVFVAFFNVNLILSENPHSIEESAAQGT